MSRQSMTHATSSTNLAELLERVLDKGVVVAGDIKIKLVEIELLTIQIRLVICSVERAMEMGMDWWQRDPNLSSRALGPASQESAALSQQTENVNLADRMSTMENTLRRMERQLATINPAGGEGSG